MKRGFLKTNKAAPPAVQPEVDPKPSNPMTAMKRGFLKTNDKESPPARVDPKFLEPILIPASPEVLPLVADSAKVDVHNLHLRVTSLTELNIPTHFLLYPGTKEAMIKEYKPVTGKPPLSSFPFVIKEVPGQGRGTFVKNAYNTGDLIWDEHPIFVAPRSFPSDSALPWEHYLKMAIDHLPPHFSSMFYGLHNSKSNNPRDIRGILDTNAIGIGRLPGPYEGDHAGIFLAISRINHSCVPNAEYNWNCKTFTYYLAASRPIAAGEQVFVSYIPLFSPRAERQKKLKSKYAFTCTCASCTLPKDLSARSDVKRKILSSALTTVPKQQKEHEHALKAWITDLSLPDDHLVKSARFLMQLMEEEQVFDAFLWLTQAEIACKALCALSDRAGAVELARKASAYAKTRFFGDDAGWSKVAAAPEQTEWWGLRTKNTY